MPDKVRLFYHPISHYCVSAERMLRYKGVRFELVYAPYHDHQELLRVSGQDYIPTLLWNGKVVTWGEIASFLDRVRPKPTLIPTGKAGLARTLENWGHLVLEERVWGAVVTRVPPVMQDDEERWVFEEMQTRARGPWHVLESRRKEFTAELLPFFAMVDSMLEGREWILDEPTVADFGIYGGLSPWRTVGEKIPARFAHVARWVSRIEKL
ncbi:MAG: glutathione S-transferase family protein [Thermoplasmata archaeon]